MNTLTQVPNQQIPQSWSTTWSTSLQTRDDLWNSQLSVNQSPFIQEVIEGLMDGILIVSKQGNVLYSNSCADRLCDRMRHPSETTLIPASIWHICEMLIESYSLFPNQLLVLEDEIHLQSSETIRVRVRWMEMIDSSQPFIAVTLEDREQSLRNVAFMEARKYRLTQREAEVWLLRRINRSYKAIAEELHIALDTVKKHVRSINAKRGAFHDEWIA
jgi:DNA-binding CsgD family transcriptional regulator